MELSSDETRMRTDIHHEENTTLTAFAMAAAGIGAWEFDFREKTMIWDECCRELFGFTTEPHIPADTAFKNVHPDDILKVKLLSTTHWRAIRKESLTSGAGSLYLAVRQSAGFLLVAALTLTCKSDHSAWEARPKISPEELSWRCSRILHCGRVSQGFVRYILQLPPRSHFL